MNLVLVGLLGIFISIFGLISRQLPISCYQSLLADNEDAKLSVPELIEKYGYPVEVHNITTEDGYILQAHRIPYGKKCGPGENKRVIWLQHGLLGASSHWVVAGPEKGLVYNLADECYDVWLGNCRGNTYGRNHVDLDPLKDKEQFWNFSFNEMGVYDIPADIDYVLNVTGVDGIYYIGHSMGTTAFWVAMSERPEYNSKIKLMNAYAPVAFTEHLISPFRPLAPLDNQLEWLLNMLGLHEMCHLNSPIKVICNNIFFLASGYTVDQLEPELLTTILGHSPAGTSVRSVVHFSQGINSGKFRKYDFGKEQNLEKYGQSTPPEYDLKKITAPVAFYWGENDWLSVKADIDRLAEQLANLKRIFRVNHDKYNHFDFLWAEDNLDLINRQTIEFMKNF